MYIRVNAWKIGFRQPRYRFSLNLSWLAHRAPRPNVVSGQGWPAVATLRKAPMGRKEAIMDRRSGWLTRACRHATPGPSGMQRWAASPACGGSAPGRLCGARFGRCHRTIPAFVLLLLCLKTPAHADRPTGASGVSLRVSFYGHPPGMQPNLIRNLMIAHERKTGH